MDGYMSYQSGRGAVSTAGSERFESLTHTIESNIQKISQNVSSITKMVNQLQTEMDSQELRTQLRNIQHYTQQLVKDTSTLLIELMNMQLAPNQTEAKQTKNRLSDQYLSTLNQFQSIQKQAAQKTKEGVQKTKAQNFNINNAFNQNRNNRGGSEETFIDMEVSARRQEQATLQSERDLQELEQRERDMQELETNIVDVNDIFKKLGEIITVQGMVVDSIEASIEHTADNVHGGTVQLREASVYQNKARRKKIYLLIALVLIITIILAIIFGRN